MREEGPRALFKGLTPVMLRAFPANAVSTLGFIQVTSYVQVRLQHNKHLKVLVNSFHLNGHTLGLHPQTGKIRTPLCPSA